MGNRLFSATPSFADATGTPSQTIAGSLQDAINHDRTFTPSTSGATKTINVRIPYMLDNPLITMLATEGVAALKALLVTDSADINLANAQGLTLLHVAAIRDDAALIETLIDAGAHINATDRMGNTPLHIAQFMRMCNAVKALERRGADDQVVNDAGVKPSGMPALLADPAQVTEPYVDFIRRFDARSFGQSIVVSTSRPMSVPLSLYADDLNLLINSGLSSATLAPGGFTLLHTAAFFGRSDMAVAAINAGLSVDARDDKGNTPLHIACALGHGMLAQTFVARGADVGIQDARGKTAFELTRATDTYRLYADYSHPRRS
ncbi:ankyrin repeat protein [Pandoravirus inopinatum]|uniref:Ankyrin repeat protein n=1 Tax=Pandoravirus inopinatum TaxID=1605721 RepID=A0A0B5J6C6_9VIRU|nr:ankyrin repeat protein [Pandoravirus inopinatum]AJF97300.1 ankyrin repeat protein [Pandoravirus inopinatum]